MSNIAELQLKLDAFKSMRDLRLEEQRKVDTLKKQELELQYELITALDDDKTLNGIIGSTHKALLKESTVPIITDYSLFSAYIVDNGAWDLAQTLKVSAPGVRCRWEDDIQIPGIGSVVETKLSVTKL
jgi:hypothetical protein